MKRCRYPTWGVVAVLAASLAVACSKKDEALPHGRSNPEVDAMLKVLPADASVVVGLDLERARGHALLQKMVTDLFAQLPPELLPIQQICQLDPARDLP